LDPDAGAGKLPIIAKMYYFIHKASDILQTFRHFQNLDLHDLRIYSRYTQPDPAGGDIPAHSMVLEWWGQLSSSFRSIQSAPEIGTVGTVGTPMIS